MPTKSPTLVRFKDHPVLWHPLTREALLNHGFTLESPASDMLRGTWRVWPECPHRDGADNLSQYPITLEHEVRGVVLKIFEPPMLDLLRYLG